MIFPWASRSWFGRKTTSIRPRRSNSASSFISTSGCRATTPSVVPVAKLNKIEGYKKQFQKVFGTDVNADGMAKALAAFERTVLSGGAPYDHFKGGDTKALSESAQRGMKVFFNRGHCSACHVGPNFTDGAFHNIGIGMDHEKPDIGREEHSKQEGDRGSFKTPTLREIARTAPYMHNGKFKTLE